MSDDRNYIKVHDGIEDHPKIITLSDRAFRLLVTTWAWCSRHRTNGRVPLHVWHRRGTAKARAELIKGGLTEVGAGEPAVHMHDYLEHQTSAEEITEKIATKQRAGRLGNHRRWHLDRGVIDPSCEFCAESTSDSVLSQDRSQDSTHDRSQDRSHNDHKARSRCDPKTSPETETETETELVGTSGGDRYVGKRTRERSTPRDIAATSHSPTAHRLVDQYAATRSRRPPGRVLSKLAPYVDELLAEDWPHTLIADALAAWGDKGLDPCVLPSVANEVANRRAGNGKPSTTDERVLAAQQLKSLYANEPDPGIEAPQITAGDSP